MTARQQAEQWILSKCSKTDEPIDVPFSKTDLPLGVSIGILKRTFGRMKRDGLISGGILISDNAGYSLLKLKRLEIR